MRVMRNPFQRRGDHDRKLALLRRADTERDSQGFSISGERKRTHLIKTAPITLPRVRFLELDEDDDDG